MLGRVNPWVLLSIAIVAEVLGSSSLKASQNFSHFGPSVWVALGFGLTFYLLSIIVQKLPLGLVYAIWGGVGTALTALGGVLFFNETLNGLQILALGGIVLGVVLLNLSSDRPSSDRPSSDGVH